MGIETILAAASLGATAVGGITGAVGASNAAKAERDSQIYQAQVAQNNAVVETNKARLQEQAGAEQARVQGLKTGEMVSHQRAALAAAGAEVNEGTAVDDQAGTAMTGRLDALHLYDNAMQAAYGNVTNATNYKTQAQMDLKKASNATRAGDINAESSLLSAAGSFGSKWAGFARSGAIPSFGGDSWGGKDSDWV